MRPRRVASAFRIRQRVRSITGRLYLWRAPNANAIYLTVGPRQDARHRLIGHGTAARFDVATGVFSGLVIAPDLIGDDPLPLPLHATLTLDAEALAEEDSEHTD